MYHALSCKPLVLLKNLQRLDFRRFNTADCHTSSNMSLSVTVVRLHFEVAAEMKFEASIFLFCQSFVFVVV